MCVIDCSLREVFKLCRCDSDETMIDRIRRIARSVPWRTRREVSRRDSLDIYILEHVDNTKLSVARSSKDNNKCNNR